MSEQRTMVANNLTGLTILPDIWADEKLDCISKVIVSYINSLPGGVFSPSDITVAAKILGVSRNMVTRRLRQLQNDGYLQRTQWTGGA